MAKKIKWTKYYKVKDGMPAKFACASHPAGIDLTNENIPLKVIKKLFDLGIRNIVKIEPAATGEDTK